MPNRLHRSIVGGVRRRAGEERTRPAMRAVSQKLIRRNGKLVTPLRACLRQTPLDPGYIKGYLPGIRENGGQYTHPALWVIQAFAQLGEVDAAFEVFDLINRSITRRRRPIAPCNQVEPYVVPRMSTVCRRTWVAAAGRGTRDRRRGCIARPLKSLLGFNCAAEKLSISPRVPRTGPVRSNLSPGEQRPITSWLHRPGELGSAPRSPSTAACCKAQRFRWQRTAERTKSSSDRRASRPEPSRRGQFRRRAGTVTIPRTAAGTARGRLFRPTFSR